MSGVYEINGLIFGGSIILRKKFAMLFIVVLKGYEK